MGVKRYTATADNTISNAWQSNLTRRATGSNMGAADVLEVYSIYGRAYTASVDNKQVELSRILVQFPVDSISTDRSNGAIPASGSVSFYLKLFNAETTKTVPENYTLTVKPVSQSWQEGTGLDLENYLDYTVGNTGSNWVQRKKEDNGTVSDWAEAGGDYLTASNFNQVFESGLENLEVDVTILMEEWLGSVYSNYGFGISLSASQEATASYNLTGAADSFYTKRFFARGTQYFFKKPVIEARWDSSIKDDRANFYYSSSLASGEQNINTLYFYNYVRGQLQNLPDVGTGLLRVALHSGSVDNTAPSGSKLTQVVDDRTGFGDSQLYATAGHVSTGIYSCSLGITASKAPLTNLFDVWYSGSTEYFTGSINPSSFEGQQISVRPSYYLNISNLKQKYRSKENARFNLYIREKFWSPTIYTKANNDIETTTIDSASFRVFRVIDDYDAVPHGTGSDMYTILSHDVSGNYFDLDMSLLEPGYEYAFKFAFYDSSLSDWVEQDETFRFRVENYEY
tara:strand:- start:565 stop:2100 length:1536 start_codon:yes stop_codon:yes gene_type:complete